MVAHTFLYIDRTRDFLYLFLFGLKLVRTGGTQQEGGIHYALCLYLFRLELIYREGVQNVGSRHGSLYHFLSRCNLVLLSRLTG